MNRIKNEISKDEYKKLKNIHWTLRKKPTDLNESEKEQLSYLFSLSPQIARAYGFSNDLTKIFEKKIPKSIAKEEIKGWIDKVTGSGLDCFDKFIGTLNKYFDFITNYFVDRANSGFVEGLNNKLKVIKRTCYGIRNPENFFRRIFLSLSGYRLYA